MEIGSGRGYVYTLASIIFVAPIFLFLVSYMNAASSTPDRTDKIVADQIGNFERNVENDFGKAAKIAAKRAVLSAVSYVIINGTGIGNASSSIVVLMTNGTISGQPQLLMDNSTLNDWLEKMDARARGTSYVLSIDYSNLKVKPQDSFTLYFETMLYVNITSFNNKTKVQRSAFKNFTMSIEDIEDPLVPLNTYGFVKRIIKKSPYSNPVWLAQGTNASGSASGTAAVSSDQAFIDSVSDKGSKILVTHNLSNISGADSFKGAVANLSSVPPGFSKPYVVGVGTTSAIQENLTIYLDAQTKKVWFLDNFTKDVDGKYYHASANGSSFLDRLEGRLNASDYYRNQTQNVIGLETFVNILELSANSVVPKPLQTVIDPLYWDSSTRTGYAVRGMYFWFRLDDSSAARYNVSELLS